MEMMVNGRDEQYHHHHYLGLSLSLSIAGTTAPVVEAPQRALSVAPIPSIPAAPPPQCWNGAGLLFSHSAGDQQRAGACMHADPRAAACHEMPFLRGIDVNRAPAGERPGSYSEEDEEPGASSPNSTLSSLSGKRGAPARSGGEQEMRAGSDDEDSGAGAGGGGGSRKKLRLSKDQSAVLEESFKEHNSLNPKQKAALARQLNLKPRQVEVWFQNRRARTKLKQTEVDCEFLKRFCETLTEENRRLHKEAQELRALKLVPPQLYMRMPPPTTLTMCPSCQRLVSGKPDAAAEGRTALARPVPSRPWGPVPPRPMFLDRPAQRS